MEAPAITRHRQPFFAPLWLSLLAAAGIVAVGVSLYRGAGTTVVILARPAEKDPATIADPPLSAEGEERAERLARMFGAGGAAGLDAIYVSDDRRAQQTVAPLAERLHRVPVVFARSEAQGTAGRLLHEHAGGTVLVIAGGAGFAQMLRALGGAETALPSPDDTQSLYVVSVPSFGRPRLVRLRL